jgi:hypothetical protein
MAAELRRHYGVHNAEVIYNARNPDQYAGAEKEPFIFTSGRVWDQAKNIAALRQIADRPGGGEANTGSLRALGRLSANEIRDHYSRAAIYALPALYEPFGLSPLEAALSGCALVLGDIPSLREVWDDAALFVDGRERQSLTNCLNSLAADPLSTAVYGRRARGRALLYTPQRMATRYLDVYARAGMRRRTCRRRRRHACSHLLPLADFRLEPRQRSLFAGNRGRDDGSRYRCFDLRAG